MLHLAEDTAQLEQILFAECPVQSIGIRMKIRALYRAYGMSYPFCSYYISEDGMAVGVLFHSTLFFSDALARSLYWKDSLSILPVSSISSDTPLDLTGFETKQGIFFKKENLLPDEQAVSLEYGDIEAAYGVLREVFPETFRQGSDPEQKDFYMQWYCEISHRIRHGVTDVAVLDRKATASVYCIENDAVFLSQIGVLPGLRGGGWGRKLLTAVMRKYTGRICYVFSKNPSADKFYRALGFLPVGTWQDYIRKD